VLKSQRPSLCLLICDVGHLTGRSNLSKLRAMDAKKPPEKLSAKAQPDGRIAYTVYGVVTVYTVEEAVNLMDTGTFQINPELMRIAKRSPVCEVDAITLQHSFPVPA
jgi:hypothetical protein